MMKPAYPILAAALLYGCKAVGPSEVPINPDAKLLPVSKATVKQPIEAIRGFSAKMLTWVVRQGGTENTMVSPFSLAEVLTMLYPGATGKGKAELEALLGPNPDMSPIRKSLGPLEKGGILNQANAAWIRSGAQINPAYLEALKKLSGPQVHQSDFPEPALSEINDFANTQTHGRIPEVLTELNPQTVLVLANAIYFKDQWSVLFDASETHRSKFASAKGAVSVPFMHAVGEYLYIEESTFQALTLPYRSRLRMTLWLPKKGVALERVVAASRLKTSAVHQREGVIDIPKWKGESSIDLLPVFDELGLASLCKSGSLEGIFSQAYVSKGIQKTWVQTDETGTEAAAVTVVETLGKAAEDEEAPKPFRFVADHPFAYTIHTPEGAILFCGVVRKP